jgi:hypothetical protein
LNNSLLTGAHAPSGSTRSSADGMMRLGSVMSVGIPHLLFPYEGTFFCDVVMDPKCLGSMDETIRREHEFSLISGRLWLFNFHLA